MAAGWPDIDPTLSISSNGSSGRQCCCHGDDNDDHDGVTVDAIVPAVPRCWPRFPPGWLSPNELFSNPVLATIALTNMLQMA